MENLPEILLKSFEKRKKLQNISTAYRLCNGKADGLDGLVIDRYGTHYQIQFFNRNLLKCEQELIQMLKNAFSPEFIAVKYRFINHGRIKTAFGNISQTVVEENGCRFSVDLLNTLNPGLFLDMRDARLFFAGQCMGKEVLNLFAYTCSFGIYARKNGAVKAVNADISRKNLSKGRKNFELNGLTPLPGEFFCGSSEEYVNWAVKKGKKFGAIAIDPPSFAKNGKNTFSVAKDLGNLAVEAVSLLESGGILLLATNYSEWSGEILRETAIDAFAKNGKKCKILSSGTQGEDFPGAGQSKESCMNFIICKLL